MKSTMKSQQLQVRAARSAVANQIQPPRSQAEDPTLQTDLIAPIAETAPERFEIGDELSSNSANQSANSEIRFDPQAGELSDKPEVATPPRKTRRETKETNDSN